MKSETEPLWNAFWKKFAFYFSIVGSVLFFVSLLTANYVSKEIIFKNGIIYWLAGILLVIIAVTAFYSSLKTK